MAEEITEKKRGRPKKVAPPEYNEESNGEMLKMEEKPSEKSDYQRVTVQDVQVNMQELYAKALGINPNVTWIENMHNLQANNPFLQNQRLKTIAGIPGIMSGEELGKALASPQNSELPLRKQGLSLSSTQYLYYKILRMAADVPLFKYYKTPELLKDSEYSKKDFVEEDKYVDEWLTNFDVKNTLKRISLEVKREGKCAYVLRNSTYKDGDGQRHVNYCTWQKLPSDYIKLTGIGEHGYIASMNMLLFLNPAFSVKQYPLFIQQIWQAMLESGAITEKQKAESRNKRFSKEKYPGQKYFVEDPTKLMNFQCNYSDSGVSKTSRGILESADKSYMFWCELPQELCYVFASDMSHPWAVPDTSGLFLSLQDLSDYDQLAGLVASTPLTALMTGEVPLIGDANLNAGADQTALSPGTVIGYQNKFNASVSSNLDAYFAPFKNMKLQSLPNVPNSSDITTKATQNFISKAGVAGLITATEKPSVAQVKAAQLLYEAECDYLTKQFESVLNMIINRIIGTRYEWKLHLWGGIYTFDSEVKRDKELFVSGATFVLPKLASAYDMNLRDVKSVDAYVKSLGVYSDFQTITQAAQANAEDGNSTGKVGRPEVDENDIDNDNTQASKDSGLDTADMRDFVMNCVADGKCSICKKDSDTFLCDECVNFVMDLFGEQGVDNNED